MQAQTKIKLTITEYELILVLGHAEYTVISKNLAKILGKDPSVISRTINSLKNKGLITKNDFSNDKRKYSLEITEQAQEVLVQCLAIELKLVEEVKQKLKEFDKEYFRFYSGINEKQ